jgi:SpoVK/Ycf46/Vps4 family AAA+-type ATPase
MGGVLFYGPSGCGKVFSVEVIASELDATMFLFDVGAGWDRKQFEQTVQAAVDSEPGQLKVLHFENVDSPAVATLRTDTLIATLDAARDTVITASATLPWQASGQIVQQGRLSRVLLVLPPDPPSRARFILERTHGHALISDDELNWLVEHTDGYSFTDIQALLDAVITTAIKEQGAEVPQLDRSALRVARRDVPPSSAQWLSQAGHHALMNERGGMYDDLLQYFQMRQRR